MGHKVERNMFFSDIRIYIHYKYGYLNFFNLYYFHNKFICMYMECVFNDFNCYEWMSIILFVYYFRTLRKYMTWIIEKKFSEGNIMKKMTHCLIFCDIVRKYGPGNSVCSDFSVIFFGILIQWSNGRQFFIFNGILEVVWNRAFFKISWNT